MCNCNEMNDDKDFKNLMYLYDEFCKFSVGASARVLVLIRFIDGLINVN